MLIQNNLFRNVELSVLDAIDVIHILLYLYVENFNRFIFLLKRRISGEDDINKRIIPGKYGPPIEDPRSIIDSLTGRKKKKTGKSKNPKEIMKQKQNAFILGLPRFYGYGSDLSCHTYEEHKIFIH